MRKEIACAPLPECASAHPARALCICTHTHSPWYKRGNGGGGGRNESGAVRGGLLINQKPNQGSPYQQMPKGKHERGARGGGGKIAMERERETGGRLYTFHCSPGSTAQMSAAQDNMRTDVLHSTQEKEPGAAASISLESPDLPPLHS